jgi:outer membrane protein TolC
VLERNVELAEEGLELTREQYRLGTVQYINLQRAIDDLDAAEQQAFEQRYELLKRWAELEELAGGGPVDGP